MVSRKLCCSWGAVTIVQDACLELGPPSLATCIIGGELLIFLMPQTSIRHVSFHGFDYSKALYVSRRHLLGYLIAVAAILVLIAFILHSPSRIKSSFWMFSYRLQAQSISLSALGCRPWQPIQKHANPAFDFTKLTTKSCNWLWIILWKLLVTLGVSVSGRQQAESAKSVKRH